MIFRPLNLIGFLAAATAGLHLYQTKHEVALMDRELRSLAKQIDEAQDRTQALNAEWAWLNEPERLRAVAQRHLPLEPMQPSQFLRLGEAERKLPTVVAYNGPTALFAAREPTAPAGPVQLALLPRVAEPVQVARGAPAAEPAARPTPEATQVAALPRTAAPAPQLAPLAGPPPVISATAVAPPVIVPPIPAPPVPAPQLAGAREPAGPVVAATPAAPIGHPSERPRIVEPRVELARAAPQRPPMGQPVVQAAAAPRPAPRPLREVATLASVNLPVAVAPARPTLASRPATPLGSNAVASGVSQGVTPGVTQVASVPAVRIADPPVTSLGSALGGRPSLAPPVPFGSANAASYGNGR
jgi:hypothetical protein